MGIGKGATVLQQLFKPVKIKAMLKDINYWWVSLFLVAMVALIVWVIRRDRKDEKAFEKDLLEQEVREEDKDHDEKSPDNL